MGGAHSEREDLRRVHRGPISYENVLLSINLTSRKKCGCIGGINKGKLERLGVSFPPPPLDRTLTAPGCSGCVMGTSK